MKFIDELIEGLKKPKNQIGLVAFVLTTIAMGAIFNHASATTDVVPIGGHGAKQFTIKFKEYNESYTTISDSTKQGETTHKDITINHTNITKISFKLTWNDDMPPDDTFKLTISPPEGSNLKGNFTTSNPESSNSGEIIVEVNIKTLPSTVRVRADSKAKAAEYNKTYFGSGKWGADIKAVDCPPDPYIPFAPDPDDGNEWTLEATIYYYIGDIKEAKEEITKEA